MSDGLLKWENPGRRPSAGVGRLGPQAPAESWQKAQRRLEGRRAEVVLWDGRRFRADGVEVSPEAVVGWEAGSGTRHSAPPGDVEAVCYRERGRGALEGAGLGAWSEPPQGPFIWLLLWLLSAKLSSSHCVWGSSRLTELFSAPRLG
jgi:hypothetical protein